jgi:hypothetical protein
VGQPERLFTRERNIPNEDEFVARGLVPPPAAVVTPDVEAEFNALVLPLEQADGRTLNGPGRRACLRAYRENPVGFERLVAIALEKASRSKRGLLIYMCQGGEHRLDLGEVE